MHLKSLRIQGFKTFARRTDLSFSRGITAMVGPNGSGKSNLVDAIRWALGERSPRDLRGNRMEDVIYSGGPGKSAVGMAEVSLMIDNADQRINVEFTEIEVARRLYRSGESEYLINGTRARLKDIDALLASTGLRQEGYAVVAQNDIEYVIQAAPALRRELIEEAAGVRRLRDQRQEAVNRLAEAERDLERARDLLNELTPRAEELRAQAVAADEYQQLAAQLKRLQGSLARDAWRKAMVQLRRAQTREHAAQTKRDAAAVVLAEFEPLYSSRQAELIGVREARWNHQQALADLRLRVAESQHQAMVADERRQAALLALDAARKEAVRLAGSERAGGQVVEEMERAVAAVSAELADANRIAAAAAADERASREAQAVLEAERAALQSRRQDLHREHVAAAAELRQLEGRVQFLKEQSARALAETEAWSTRHQGLLEDLADQEALSKAGEREVGGQSAVVTELDARLEEVNAAIQHAEQRLAASTVEAQARDAEAAGLRLLRDRDRRQSPLGDGSVLGLRRLLEMIEVEERYRPAVEGALEAWLSGWLADRDVAERAMAVVANGESSGETILFDPGGSRSRELPAGVESLAAFVSAPAGLERLLSHLLHGVTLVNDLAAAKELLSRYPELVAVTRAGEVLTAFSYRGARVEQGPLRLEAQLRAADAARQSAKAVVVDRRREVDAQLAARAGATEDRARALARLDAGRAEQALAGAGVAAATLARERAEEEGRQLDRQLARVNQMVAQTEQLQRETRQRQETTAEEDHRLNRELCSIDEGIREGASALAGGMARRRDAELKSALASQRHHDLVEQLQRATQAWRSHGDELGQSQAAAQALEAQPAVLQAEQARWRATSEDLSRQLAELEARQLPDEASINALEARLREDEQRNVTLQVELAHADDGVAGASLEVTTAQAEVERCALALHEDGGTPTEDEEEPIEEVGWQKAEREVSRLQRRLDGMGAVNLLAPEEYTQLRDRCESLRSQLTDLETAAHQLMELRQRLDDEIDQRFRTVFQSVAVSFQEFFVELFEGGRATLRMEAQPDGSPLDEGVEILAQTPGKRLQPLTLLSGGERALTALAFLFALQAVNPSPFYVLDEVDAALDDANVVRFNRVLRRLAREQQFLLVTHNHSTMAQAEVLYGVTLAEHGISRIVSVRLDHGAAVPQLSERTA